MHDVAAKGGGGVPGSEHRWRLLTLIDVDLAKLPAQDEQALRLLYGVGETLHSREEVAQRLGMPRPRLRQVERRALAALRGMSIADDTAVPGTLHASGGGR